MTREATTRRHMCRPDRAKRHGELADMAQLNGIYSLCAWVKDCGGEESWDELVDRIDAARRILNEHVSLYACICGLSVLAAFHKHGEIGFRGVIGSSELVAARVAELIGAPRGLSARTMRSVWRVLEAAELLERWRHGRGRQRPVEAPVAPEQGKAPRKHRRQVLALTLTVVAISYWSAPRRKSHRGPHVVKKTTVANFAENTIGGARETLSPCNAPASISSAPSPAHLSDEVSAVPADVEHRTAGRRGPRASPVPRRFVPFRPDPTDPNDYGAATRAVLYDLETVLLHHRREDRARIVGLARAELDPARRIAGLGVGSRGSGLPWDEWIWRWRGLPISDRRIACERALLPALVGHLRRLDLWALEPDPDARPPARHQEPGPRLLPQVGAAPRWTQIEHGRPPPWSSRPRPPNATAPEPDWLKDLKRRHGGMEEK